MKKSALLIVIISLLSLNLVGQCINNPSLQQGSINPAPLTSNTGTLEFSFFENLLDYTAWQTDPVTITLCLLNMTPQNGASSVGGSYYQTFNWIYDPVANCLQGTQNQVILGGTGGLITLDFDADTTIVCPNNQLGFNVSLQPAACMNGINETVDDTESVYTCYAGGGSPNCTFGQVNVNSSTGSTTVGFSVTTPPSSATYLWDFGDGNTSNAAAPTHLYTNFGTYNGTVTVDDGLGPCTENFSVTLVNTNGNCVNNPSVQQGAISTAPLTSSTGTMEFSFVENLLDYTAWQTDPVTLTLCLLNITPQNGAASVNGSYHQNFNWVYDPISNCLQGTQNQTIFGGSGGLITVDFNADTTIACPTNQLGFNVNIGIPACMGPINETVDDTESFYTCYAGGGTNCTFGQVNVNSTISSLTVGFDVSMPPVGATYLWDFGDGNSSTLAAPTNIYSNFGTYNGSVTVDDGSGPCSENFTVTLLSNGTCVNNPSVLQGSILGAPLSTSAGTLEFSFVETLNDYAGWQGDPVSITICMLNMTPQNGVSSIDGSYHQAFNWTYDPITNCFLGVQNQTILAGVGGLITVDFDADTTITCPLNQIGFNVNVQPASCMNGHNLIPDDTESVYTCYDPASICSGNLQATQNGSDFVFSLLGHSTPILYYSWDFGDGTISGDPTPTHTYAVNGNYLLRLVIIDSLFNQCTFVKLVTYNGGNLCIDATLIDLTHVCSPVYNPVCGCDNVTYDNACIAEKCFGVANMTSGPCSTASDTTCTTSASYLYTDMQGPNGHEVFFVASGAGAGPLNYYWDFGDGTTGTGTNPIHIYSDTTSIDSIQAFTVCLAVQDSVQCVATYCETIVVVVNPNGNIAGGVFESSNFTGNGGVNESFGGGGDPIPGVTVNLERADGVLISTDVTDAQGQYSFNQLQFGDYRIRLVMPGIIHDGKEVSIDPFIQFKNNLDFEVESDGTVTGLENKQWLSQFELIPNPAGEQVMIQITTPLSEEVTLSIINLAGKAVYNKPVQLNKDMKTVVELELSGLVAGVYFVVMQSASGIVTEKLVKH